MRALALRALGRGLPGLMLMAAVTIGSAQTGLANGHADGVYVRNSGNVPLSTLRVSPDYSTRWGDDRLGPGQLHPGDAVKVDLPDRENCFYDVQVGDVTGEQREFWGIDLCNQRTFEVRRADGLSLPDKSAEPD